MSRNAKSKQYESVVTTEIDVVRSFSLVHSLRNYALPTSDELYEQDLNAFFGGEEGYDFAYVPDLCDICPEAAAVAAQPVSNSNQQQQNVPSVKALKEKYTQQQQQTLQLVI